VSTVSARAVDVIDDIATRWGEDLGDGIVRIRRAQTSIARDLGCSAGTVAWYLSHAGDTVRRDGADILVDRSTTTPPPAVPRGRSSTDDIAAALIEDFGRPADGGRVELLDRNDKPPTTRTMAAALSRHHSTIHAHLTRLEDQGQLTRLGRRIFLSAPATIAITSRQTAGPTRPPARPTGTFRSPEVQCQVEATLLATLSQAVALLAEAANTLTQLATQHSVGPRSVGSQIADTRDLSPDTASQARTESAVDLPKPNPTPPTTATSCFSISEPSSRQSDNVATTQTTPRHAPTHSDSTAATSQRLSDAELEETLAPLVEACDRYRLPAIIDRRGRDMLKRQPRAALEAAVAEAIRLARTGGLKSPLGFLVSRAAEEPAWFEQALRSRHRAASRNKAQPDRDAERASNQTSETQISEARWVAQILEETQLRNMVARYRARHPKRSDPLTASIGPLITQAARDAVAAHRDLEAAQAAVQFTAAHFDARLTNRDIPDAEIQLPLSDDGPHLSALLKRLDI